MNGSLRLRRQGAVREEDQVWSVRGGSSSSFRNSLPRRIGAEARSPWPGQAPFLEDRPLGRPLLGDRRRNHDDDGALSPGGLQDRNCDGQGYVCLSHPDFVGEDHPGLVVQPSRISAAVRCWRSASSSETRSLRRLTLGLRFQVIGGPLRVRRGRSCRASHPAWEAELERRFLDSVEHLGD